MRHFNLMMILFNALSVMATLAVRYDEQLMKRDNGTDVTAADASSATQDQTITSYIITTVTLDYVIGGSTSEAVVATTEAVVQQDDVSAAAQTSAAAAASATTAAAADATTADDSASAAASGASASSAESLTINGMQNDALVNGKTSAASVGSTSASPATVTVTVTDSQCVNEISSSLTTFTTQFPLKAVLTVSDKNGNLYTITTSTDIDQTTTQIVYQTITTTPATPTTTSYSSGPLDSTYTTTYTTTSIVPSSLLANGTFQIVSPTSYSEPATHEKRSFLRRIVGY